MKFVDGGLAGYGCVDGSSKLRDGTNEKKLNHNMVCKMDIEREMKRS